MRLKNSFLLALGICVVAGAFLFRLRPQPVPLALPEAARANLKLTDGRLYQLGHTNPFTGYMVEFYPHHVPLSRSVVSNGLLEGVSESWYTNGQIQLREYFKKGVSDGLREKWHANGRKLSEANIRDGKIEGTFRRWFDNGQLAEEIEMLRGHPNGGALAYYPSGFVKAKTRAQEGTVLTQKTWNDGELRE